MNASVALFLVHVAGIPETWKFSLIVENVRLGQFRSAGQGH